jgi:hypothetical protein
MRYLVTRLIHFLNWLVPPVNQDLTPCFKSEDRAVEFANTISRLTGAKVQLTIADVGITHEQLYAIAVLPPLRESGYWLTLRKIDSVKSIGDFWIIHDAGIDSLIPLRQSE